MRNPAKPCRAVVELTDAQDESFGRAIESDQEDRATRISRQSVLLELLADYCRKQGVKFPAPTRRGRPTRRPAEVPKAP